MLELKSIRENLLSVDTIKSKIFENENYLIEAIKNEFSIPILKERLQKEVNEINETAQFMKATALQDGVEIDGDRINNMMLKSKSLKEKIIEMELEQKYNLSNIEVYQDFIQYLNDLLSKKIS